MIEKIMINWFSRNGAQGYAPFSLKVIEIVFRA